MEFQTKIGSDKSFGKQVVLKNLHLEIQQGEFHVILGPGGEGKSTLLGTRTK
ncbi:MAG: ATP-binding cassette domain-containing protein [Deltaproteobacteria bacterium]|nr:ATP-binding cassette domain-containing protein [Deltaproteobacteria bacterium]